MSIHSLLLCFLLILSLFSSIFGSTPSIQDQCSTEFTKLGPCLEFATGKKASPTKDCCSAVSELKSEKPVCLCYVIQQTHNGSTQMGLQEAKLLQLPSACKMANASLSACPGLLNLSPSSPDYGIFTNASSPDAAIASPTSVTSKDSSLGFTHRPNFLSVTTITIIINILSLRFQ